MDNTDRQSLEDNAELIKKDLVVDDEFLLHFEKDRILSPGMIESIELSRPAQASEFARIIAKRGPKGYERFIEALMETGQVHIAVKLCPVRAEQWQLQSVQSSSSNSTHIAVIPTRRRKIPDTGQSLIEIDVVDVDQQLAQHIVKSGDAYPCKSKPRGRAIILNNEFFVNKSEREGSTFDAVNLDQLYERLGFVTETWKDLKAKEIIESMKKEREHEMHKKADAFIFTILSHANHGCIFGSDGESLKLESLFAMVDGNACTSLINKPKIFIIQACQGNLVTHGSVRSDGDSSDSKVVPEALPVPSKTQESISSRDTMETVPMVHEKADFVLAYSTVPGYKSWRNTEQGTWFIRDLIYTFMERCHQDDLIDMLREVNNKQRSRITEKGQKQISETRNTTCKKIYFLPGYFEI